MSREEDEMAIEAILDGEDESEEEAQEAQRDRMLAARVKQEMSMAQGVDTSKLSHQRAEAMKRYLGEPYGNEVKGKSNITTREVMDTIEWIKPELMKIFSGGGDTIRFEPESENDEAQARQETDYCNYVLHRKNRGFNITYQWITDGLLQKNGIVKAYYDDAAREEREDYSGITEDEMLMLITPDNVEVIEMSEYPDPVEKEQRDLIIAKMRKQQEAMREGLRQRLQQATEQAQQLAAEQPLQQNQINRALTVMQQQVTQREQQVEQQIAQIEQQPPTMVYDISIKVTSDGDGIRIVNVPPEEFFIDTDATCIASARFCAHEREMSSSDLVQMGYDRDMVEKLPSSNSETYLNEEKRARHSYDDTDSHLGEAFQSGANRMHWVKEAYVRYDYDDDGIAELRKVLMVGDRILENERVPCMPFCNWSPIMISHKFFGLSMADIVMDLQRIKTQLFRNILDNQYLANNGRYEVVENMVNYGDLLESKTHGMVRVKAPGMLKRLDTPQLSNTAFQMLQYVDFMRERRTGVSERTQGLDENALGHNTAASAVNQVMTAAQQRIELIARVFAETGLRELFHLIHRLSVSHSTRPEKFKLRDEYVEVNPRTWRHRTDSQAVVGLGNGSRDSEMMAMNLLFQNQQVLSQNPRFQDLVQPENVYALLEDQVAVLNKANVGRYFTNPGSDAALTVQQLRGQIQQLAQQLQQLQQAMQAGPQAQALQIEALRAETDRMAKEEKAEVDRRAQDLDEQEHEDKMALETAELALEQEQDRNVTIG